VVDAGDDFRIERHPRVIIKTLIAIPNSINVAHSVCIPQTLGGGKKRSEIKENKK
jgi:hypothetical protein